MKCVSLVDPNHICCFRSLQGESYPRSSPIAVNRRAVQEQGDRRLEGIKSICVVLGTKSFHCTVYLSVPAGDAVWNNKQDMYRVDFALGASEINKTQPWTPCKSTDGIFSSFNRPLTLLFPLPLLASVICFVHIYIPRRAFHQRNLEGRVCRLQWDNAQDGTVLVCNPPPLAFVAVALRGV